MSLRMLLSTLNLTSRTSSTCSPAVVKSKSHSNTTCSITNALAVVVSTVHPSCGATISSVGNAVTKDVFVDSLSYHCVVLSSYIALTTTSKSIKITLLTPNLYENIVHI